jgi:hypothetical protein
MTLPHVEAPSHHRTGPGWPPALADGQRPSIRIAFYINGMEQLRGVARDARLVAANITDL